MSSTQQSFTLSTSTKVKTTHLLGSWDNYSGQLPLSKVASKAGKWKGTFRFSTSTLKPGKRYWYYFIIDGYHVSHDPSTSSTKEPTTGRLLNILDVPKSSASAGKSSRGSVEVAKGRSLSPSKIVCPKPSKPYASRAVREADYSLPPQMDDLADKLEKSSLYYTRDVSPPSSVGSSLSSRSSGFDRNSDRSSPSSLSSLSDPSSSSSSESKCSCNRWGLTRRGDRVKLDCGGSRCGYSDDSSSCSSIDSSEESDLSESEDERPRPTKRGSGSSNTKARYVEVRPKHNTSAHAERRRR